MSWEAKARFLGLSWETVSRTSSRKFLRVESCYPESFGFLCLCIDDLVQFEEDFISRTKKLSGGVGLSQTRPIPRSPDGDNKMYIVSSAILGLIG